MRHGWRYGRRNSYGLARGLYDIPASEKAELDGFEGLGKGSEPAQRALSV